MDRLMDGQTDGQMDGQTDQLTELWAEKWMDFPYYRDEMTHLKTEAREAYFVQFQSFCLQGMQLTTDSSIPSMS